MQNPRLWNLDSPNLYVAVTRLAVDGKVIDEYETTFGIRKIEFSADRGFLLNGKRVPLQGVCNHHDLGALGAAFNVRAAQRQLEILKEMGANALRTTHNPAAPELLDLCDRMGILVMAESFDCWIWGKTPNDYALLFGDWSERDLRATIRRDRNHPSIIMWSVGNEIVNVEAPENAGIAKRLVSIVHEEDPTRGATAAINNTPVACNGDQKIYDIFGFNYRSMEYERFHKANPTIPVYGSETASPVSSRGEYFFPVAESKDGGMSDFQMKAEPEVTPQPSGEGRRPGPERPLVGGTGVLTTYFPPEPDSQKISRPGGIGASTHLKNCTDKQIRQRGVRATIQLRASAEHEY